MSLVAPPPALCTDNGAMIAWAGAERLAAGLADPLSAAPRPRWPLEEVTKAPAAEAKAPAAESKAPVANAKAPNEASLRRRFDLRQNSFEPLQPVCFRPAACPSGAD